MDGYLVVMAKPPVPGRVKTRLIGPLTARQAAGVHAAMLECVLERLVEHIATPSRWQPVVAMDTPGLPAHGGSDNNSHLDDALTVPPGWEVIDQGDGDLGQRLAHVWQTLGAGPAVFFGVDSPDIPAVALRAVTEALTAAAVAIGPVEDGGYWALAGRRFEGCLLSGIDWGTGTVYHQTLSAAQRAGLAITELQTWHDVDTPEDLAQMRRRIWAATEPALQRLRYRLHELCEDPEA